MAKEPAQYDRHGLDLPGRHAALGLGSEEFAPYVSAVDSRDHKAKWLFDGFLFIEYVNGKKHAFEEGEHLPPADKPDWQDLLARNFEPGHGLAALEQTCAETEKRIGPPLRPRQVVLTLPEPIEGATNWGELDGRKLNFSVPADRVAACEWHIDNALKEVAGTGAQAPHAGGLLLRAGTDPGSNPQFLPLIAQRIHERGKQFFWIPYWWARGAAEWKQHGFDVAWQQPNHLVIKETPGSAGGLPEFDSSGSRFRSLRVNRSKHTRKETENGKHGLRESEAHEMGMQISCGVHPRNTGRNGCIMNCGNPWGPCSGIWPDRRSARLRRGT